MSTYLNVGILIQELEEPEAEETLEAFECIPGKLIAGTFESHLDVVY